MRRFEALKPHQDAIRAIARDSVGDPAMLFRPGGDAPVDALDAGGGGDPDRRPARGHLVSGMLLALHLSVLRTFLADDSPDLGQDHGGARPGIAPRRGALPLSAPASAGGPGERLTNFCNAKLMVRMP